ncbi:collagen alpha-1(III) chain-like [Hippopotamus amphibius kiboko]|uniref:collagen alpha-1(III) chain-like n=1 Tax=Hippopotamus amphibius kiboko TaxID=575201 RepID=UPI002593EA8A|nr:collagen alpha-1(III) chain-like [Hippopotamus amphibius kiboko]
MRRPHPAPSPAPGAGRPRGCGGRGRGRRRLPTYLHRLLEAIPPPEGPPHPPPHPGLTCSAGQRARAEIRARGPGRGSRRGDPGRGSGSGVRGGAASPPQPDAQEGRAPRARGSGAARRACAPRGWPGSHLRRLLTAPHPASGLTLGGREARRGRGGIAGRGARGAGCVGAGRGRPPPARRVPRAPLGEQPAGPGLRGSIHRGHVAEVKRYWSRRSPATPPAEAERASLGQPRLAGVDPAGAPSHPRVGSERPGPPQAGAAGQRGGKVGSRTGTRL